MIFRRLGLLLTLVALASSQPNKLTYQNFNGWTLPPAERNRLLSMFPPKYDRIRADHVTRISRAPPGTPPASEVAAQVVGWADDGESLECLVVEIEGATVRPDGSIYHITWSHGRQRKPAQSNHVLRESGWHRIEKPIPIKLNPQIAS